ncbi:spore cortex-lytic enzyme [Lutibacter sp. B2]|nr:spore cortex-lytic enzyme [Lutibacter sp. B2]
MKKVMIMLMVVVLIIGAISMNLIYAGSLSWGSRGEEVKNVQMKLKKWGYFQGEIDGIFGVETYDSVVYFQKKNGIKVDGVIGNDTLYAMGLGSITKANNIVTLAQKKMKQWGYYFGKVDGVYGAKTYDAVTYFQRKNGLKVDGVIGPRTRKELGIADEIGKTNYKPTSRGISRNNDITLLAMTIHGEARGEPYVGKVSVAAVILNRVKNASFPNSIAGVIYQPLAFSAVDDGQIYLTPNEESFKAAKDALNGWDPTGGAIYYWNSKTATNEWMKSKKADLDIGNHSFAHK